MAEKFSAASVDCPGLHQVIGGTAKWRQLAVAFYARVDRDPLLRPLFPGKNLHCATEELTAFLVQLFGGPSEDTQRRWWLSLRESHLRFKIRQKERAAWVANMVEALGDAAIDEPLRSALREFFERSSAHVVNSGEPSAVGPLKLTEDATRQEIALRWDGQRGLDEAVAAVRRADAHSAIAAAEGLRNRFPRNRSVLAGLFAVMMGNRDPAMLRYVRERLTDDPAFVRERYAGRTLLHAACARGNLTMVELLQQLGADPNAQDGGGHAPLYSLANECRAYDAGEIVRILVQNGANVNANEGVKHCTALHMAARRGNAEIAEALLDYGAAIEARDSLGDTPLRRSVNCDKVQVVSLLLARGADVHSIGNKGLTPLSAARTSAMQALLRSGNDSSRGVIRAQPGKLKKKHTSGISK